MRACTGNRLIVTGSVAGLCIAVTGGAFSERAQAQSSDTSPNLPNVLLVLDTSNDMVLQPDGSPVDCTQNERSNWALVVEALTGSIQNYNCIDGGNFKSNSCLPGANPDIALTAPFSVLTDWPTQAGPPHKAQPVTFMNGGSFCQEKKNGWDQAQDGIIDGFSRQIRFGLMTSDLGHLSDPNQPLPVYGTWRGGTPTDPELSYAAGLAIKGKYGGQTVASQAWDVGARNAGALPWQGRLMGFGNPTATVDDVVTQNERIQRVILAVHPHAVSPSPPGGGEGTGDFSPAAGLLADAEYFLRTDTLILPHYPTPSDPSFMMTSNVDPAFVGGCRTTNVVFISTGKFGADMMQPSTSTLPGDGYDKDWFVSGSAPCLPPSLAMCPTYNTATSCAEFWNGGSCPFSGREPAASASSLRTPVGADQPIVTHVVGVVPTTKLTYKKSGGGCAGHAAAAGPSCEIDCSDLDSSDFNVFPYTSRKEACSIAQVLGVNYYGPPGSTLPSAEGSKWRNDRGRPQDGPVGNLSQCCELAAVAVKSQLPTMAKPPLYFIQDVSGLKTALSDIVSKVQGSTTSRTMPVYLQAAPTIQTGVNAVGSSGGHLASSFEILSSMKVSLGNTPAPSSSVAIKAPMWRGFIERRRLICDSSNLPAADTVARSRGDDFADNLVEGRTSRLFFTVVAKTGGVPATGGSLRRPGADLPVNYTPTGDPFGLADPEAKDGLGGVEVTFSDQTDLTTADAVGSQIAALYTGGSARSKYLGMDSKDKKKCHALFQTNDIDDCADYVLKWFGGWVDSNPAKQFPTDRCPFATCGWVFEERSNQHPLGAIYHSTPVMIGPPTDYLNDESYRRDFSVKDSTGKNGGQATRPTMLYAATIDGQLHAFAVARNSNSGGDPLYQATGIGPDKVPDLAVSAPKNNELWAFLPPAIIPSIWKNFDSHALLLDGPLTVADTVLKRPSTAASNGVARWGTVLVGSGGSSTAGGFYYALDVTNPTRPEFLWQLRTAGTGSVDAPLFGSSVPGAAIATVSIAATAGSIDQVAVAILAGGSESGLPSFTPPSVLRRCGSCNSTGVRGTVRDWGTGLASRSVTIVELGTGRVLKRFEGMTGDLGYSSPLLNAVRDSTHPFDSPMTGTPVAFPNTPGVSATRAYVGDADGTLWRLDLSSTNPASWKADIAADAYGALGPLDGQPIQTPASLSIDKVTASGNQGDPIVTFATGDQNGFQVYTGGMQNFIVGINDHFGSTGFVPSTLWSKTYSNGERVTGPLSLFDGTLYFATYSPGAPTTSVCTFGQPALHALNFLTGVGGSFGPALPTTSVVFGAQINRIPECFSVPTTITNDGWLAGSYATQTSASNSTYQVSFQTGQTGAAVSDDLTGLTSKGAQSNSFHSNLVAPKALVTIHSWASISE